MYYIYIIQHHLSCCPKHQVGFPPLCQALVGEYRQQDEVTLVTRVLKGPLWHVPVIPRLLVILC